MLFRSSSPSPRTSRLRTAEALIDHVRASPIDDAHCFARASPAVRPHLDPSTARLPMAQTRVVDGRSRRRCPVAPESPRHETRHAGTHQVRPVISRSTSSSGKRPTTYRSSPDHDRSLRMPITSTFRSRIPERWLLETCLREYPPDPRQRLSVSKQEYQQHCNPVAFPKAAARSNKRRPS
jgi:hypothetical protein